MSSPQKGLCLECSLQREGKQASPAQTGGCGRKRILLWPSPAPHRGLCLLSAGLSSTWHLCSNITHAKLTSSGHCCSSQLPQSPLSSVSSVRLQRRWPLDIEDISVSPTLLKFSLSTPEILLCQSQTSDFFFLIVSIHVFLKCLYSLWSVSNSAIPDPEVQTGLEGLFSPVGLSPMNYWGIWPCVVSFTLATEQWNTLFCGPEYWHLN